MERVVRVVFVVVGAAIAREAAKRAMKVVRNFMFAAFGDFLVFLLLCGFAYVIDVALMDLVAERVLGGT